MSNNERPDEESLLEPNDPIVRRWLADKSLQSLQMLQDRRLLSAEEKIDSSGGADRISGNLKDIEPDNRHGYLVLLACRNSPMVTYEIYRFTELVGQEMLLTQISMRLTAFRRNANPSVERVEGITYALKTKGNPKNFSLDFDMAGFQTTQRGVGQMVGFTERREKWGLLKRWVPQLG